MNGRLRVVTATLVTACLLGGLPATSFAKKPNQPGKVDVIMVYDKKPDKAEKARVKSLGGETRREYKNLNMRVIRVSENALKNLERGNGVRFIARDREVFSLAVPSHATARGCCACPNPVPRGRRPAWGRPWPTACSPPGPLH